VCQSGKKVGTVNGVATSILVKMGRCVKFCAFCKYLPDCEIAALSVEC
jgi:hypothetical protein